MKKLTLGIFSLAMLTMGACSSDVKDSISTVTYPTVNLITPLDGGETFATEGSYTFVLNFSKYVGSVSTRNLRIDNKDYLMDTDTVAYENYTTNRGGTLIRMQNLKGYLEGSKDMPVTNANFDINNFTYHSLIYNVVVPGYNAPKEYTVVVGQYTGGNWSVATIQSDASYYGSTTTSYADREGKMQTYNNSDMVYRVMIDITKKTADVIMYNAKFAEAMPKPLTAIILKGLSVKWNRGAYEISGENIIPEVVEGTSTTPNEVYTFSKFTLRTVNPSMTKAQIIYDVMGGAFHGEFAGAYVAEPEKK